ncbi:MAG: putative acyltransferase, partial [Acidimicrobiaceae bacterium]|nr:putative acyltransferase [Acidimicrobiaceae bacterium]
AFNRSLEVLAAGEPLVIFPEGTRQSGTEVGPLQEGAAYLALRAGVPVIPLGLGGTERSMPRGARFPHPVRVRVIVGEPLLASSVLGSEASLPSGRISRAATRAFSEALREALQKVLDEAEGRVPAADRAR